MIIVGGIFGVLGYIISYGIGLLPVIGNAGPATTDLPGITVFILAIVTRLVFGKDRPHRQVHRLRQPRVVLHRQGLCL